jgi:hypothetical protein
MWYLQRIGKNEWRKKLVISSMPAPRAESHVSAIYQYFLIRKNTEILVNYL